ncbi:MAG: DUF6913 domain-containing protein [Saprospiraceae bacterium]
MLEKLRSFLLQRLTRRTLTAQNRQRKVHTLDSARTIGILFDATDEKDRKDVLALAKSFGEKQRKTVYLLGFVDDKQPLAQTEFPQFFQKELRWNGQIVSEAVDKFLANKPDLLLCLNRRQAPPLAWVAAASKAAMKIGTAASAPHDFDMVLETPEDKGIRFFMDQLELYLTKIVPSKHESASAL